MATAKCVVISVDPVRALRPPRVLLGRHEALLAWLALSHHWSASRGCWNT
jgi:hypothetical protein